MRVSSEASTGSVVTRFDVTRRLLHIRFQGRVTLSVMEQHLHEIEAMEPRLTGGFALASDLTELDSIESGSLQMLIQVMETLRRAGVRMVVRLIPRPEKDIGFAILSAFHYPSGVHCVTCETREEFLAWLETAIDSDVS